jgi:uncharacterized RDD family membrane protein YckC
MPTALADTLESVELADGVQIHLRVAGPAARSVAWLIDILIFAAIIFILSMVIGLLSSLLIGEEVGNGLLMLAMFILNWFYNVFFEMSAKAATPGQRHMGLKVVSVSGGPVRLPQSMIRNVLRVVDFMPGAYLFGLTCCLCTSRFQRLGDLVADTVVVYADKPMHEGLAIQVNADPMPPPLPLNREEQAAMLQFLERSPRWSDARKMELSDVLEPLTKRRGMGGLLDTVRMALWLQTGGGGKGGRA